MPEQVKLNGTARNAKAGAVLCTDDGMVIYLEGLDSWPDEMLGRRVVATGALVKMKFIPDPVGEDGTLRQGAEGDQMVLKNATWAPVRGR